jgi:hypothetical protein
MPRRPVRGACFLARLREMSCTVMAEYKLPLPPSPWHRTPRYLALFLAVPMLGGCAAQTITAALPKVQPVAGEPSRIDASPPHVYGLIARGAMSCWFAATGQLKKSHIFHADVDPPTAGGAVEIAVHERDNTGPNAWGARVFKVALKLSGEQTIIDVENIKMPEAVAVPMRADVFHWAQGGRDCKLKPIEVAAAPPEPAKPKAKLKVKPPLAKSPSP